MNLLDGGGEGAGGEQQYTDANGTAHLTTVETVAHVVTLDLSQAGVSGNVGTDFQGQPGGHPSEQQGGLKVGQRDDDDSKKKQDCTNKSSNPVIFSSGNKVKEEVDFQTHHLYPARLVRTYNSIYSGQGIFGQNWASNFDTSLSFKLTTGGSCSAVPGETSSCVPASGNVASVTTNRTDGSRYDFIWNAATSTYKSLQPDAGDWIIRNADGTWTYQTKGGFVEKYSSWGFVLSTTGATGIGWTYTYSGSPATWLQTATSSGGQVVRFSWSGGRVNSVTDPANNVWNYSYTNGYLSGVTGPTGDTRTYFYEGSSPWYLTGIAFNGNRYSTYSYLFNGKVGQSSLYGGIEQLTFQYAKGDTTATTTVTNAAGAVSLYSYYNGQWGKLLASISQSGVTNCPDSSRSMTYDGNGHVQTETDQRGIQTQSVYTPTAQYPQYSGQLLQKTTGIDPNNPGQKRITQYAWDFAKDRITDVKTFGDTTSQPISDTVYNYFADTSPAKNRLSSVVVTNLTANGTANQTQTTTYLYPLFWPSGLPKQTVVSGPGIGQITRNYDAAGNLTSAVDAMNNTTTYNNYNGLGLPASVTDANGYTVSYTYDQKGRVKTISRTVDGVAGTTTYVYDGMGNVTTVTFADGGSYSYIYDNTGRLISKTNNVFVPDSWNGYVYQDHTDEKYTYNAFGKLTSDVMTLYSDSHPPNQCRGGGQAPQLQVAPSGQAGTSSIVLCPSFTTTLYSHSWTNDSLGRVLTDQGAHGQKTTYAYDPSGNIGSKTDALTQRASYTYNAHDQVQTVTDALNQITSFSYDGAGHLASVTDPKHNSTTYFYDGFGNLTKVNSPDIGTTTYVYDNLGRRTQMTRHDGVITSYTNYDALNRVGKITAGSLIQNFTYDACAGGHGRLCSFTDASGSTSYIYRVNGQLMSQISTINGTSYTTTWGYDNRDRVTKIGYPGGNSVAYAYSFQSYGSVPEVSSIKATIGTVTSDVASYVTFSGLGLGPMNAIAFGNGITATHGRDTDFRLSSITASGVQSLSYGYDNADNLTSITNSLNNSLTQSYGYDALYRLNAVTAGIGNQNLTFDANGTPMTHVYGGITDTYTPDASSNRVTSISGSRARSYVHDTLGNIKTESGWRNYSYGYDSFNHLNKVTAGANVTNYFSNALGQRARKSGPGGSYNYVYAPDGSLLAETAQNGTVIASQYIWLNGIPVGLIRNNVLYFIHDDHLGRPDSVTTAAKTVVWQASNTAFDRSVTTNLIGGLNIGFPGQYYDVESGLFYNWNRYYDPSIGRYLQADPLGLKGGLTTYAYAKLNPIQLIDPSALSAADDFLDALDAVPRAIQRFLCEFLALFTPIDPTQLNKDDAIADGAKNAAVDAASELCEVKGVKAIANTASAVGKASSLKNCVDIY